jgi:hypothetical protein
METTTTKIPRLTELRAREKEILAELDGITSQIARFTHRVEHLSPTLTAVRREMRALLDSTGAAA